MARLAPRPSAETEKITGRRPIGWETLLWMGALALVLYLMGLRNHTLWDYHEPYVGGIIREMATSGDWIVPTLNGQPYLEKPPLFYALGALACRTFGTFDPWVLRLPSALLAAATVVWVSFLGWRLSSARAAAWAGFMVATSVLFFESGHEAVVDMTLTATVTFSLGLAFLAIVEPPYRARWVPWFWVSLGLAFLAKGIFGPVVVLLPLAITLFLQRNPTLFRAFVRPNWGMGVAILLVLGWVLPLAHRGGREFLTEVFLRNSVGRFMASPDLVPRTGRLGEHVEPFTFYFTRLPGNLLPWLALWGAALWGALPFHRRHPRSPRNYFLPLAFGVNLLLLSVSEEKRMVYILPLVPITFLHTALWLDLRAPRGRARAQRPVLVMLLVTLAFVGLLGAAFPWIVVGRAQMHWPLALALTLGSVILSVNGFVLVWQRRLPRALDATMLHWALFLVTFLIFSVPYLDRQWRPILEPYHLAHDLEARGAMLYEGKLTETQLGYASLELRHTLPALDEPAALREALDRRAPVAVLAEPTDYWEGQLKPLGLGACEWPTGATTSRLLRSRAPVLLLNAPARALLRP